MFSGIDGEARGGCSRAGRSLPFKLLATWYAQVTYRIETPADIELLMPELHFFSNYDNDNLCIACATSPFKVPTS
jgi:hypothetical protein